MKKLRISSKKKWAKTKRGFTLLEVCLCTFLLTVMGSLLLGYSKEMLGEHRLQKEVQVFYANLQKWQVLALSYQADISFEVLATKKGLICKTRADEPPLQPYLSSITLSSIQAAWLPEPLSQPLKAKPVFLQFTVFASGRIEPLGILCFYKKGISHFFEIDLRFPLQIKLTKRAFSEIMDEFN